MRMALFLIAIFLSCLAAHALEMHIAPIMFVNETEGHNRNTGRVQSELLAVLRTVETGINLQFVSLKDNNINPPVSLTDAMTLCRNEHAEYLLYGYVTKRTHNFIMEVRLFEYSNRNVVQSFFGMDDPEHYDRLIEDITKKILLYIEDRFNLEILTERKKITRLEIPVMIGYWTPMDKDWVEVMLGTVAVGSGLVFIPSDNIWVVRGMPCYLSTGLEVKYRLGVGNPDNYKAYNHTLYLMTPLRLHIVLMEQHQVFIGLGCVYFLEFFRMADNYSDMETHVYNNMGLHIGFGYRFMLNQTLAIFFRNDFDFLFNKHTLVTYSPVIGLAIQVYEKEIRKKW